MWVEEKRPEAKKVIRDLNLTITSTFVPYSQTRDAVEQPLVRQRSMNWVVSLFRGSRFVVTSAYQLGVQDCPSYAGGPAFPFGFTGGIVRETELGLFATTQNFGKKIKPRPESVIEMLVMLEKTRLDSCFKVWADRRGLDPYDPDTLRLYRQGMDIYTRMRAALGDENLARLEHAYSGMWVTPTTVIFDAE